MQSSVLLRSRIFDGLSDAERERWLARGTSSSLKRGETLARQGEPARHFYLVESGFLKILQLTAEGTEVIVRFVGPGEPFGGVVGNDVPVITTLRELVPLLDKVSQVGQVGSG